LEIGGFLRRGGRRLRRAESATWGTWGLAVGLGLAVALALVARLVPLLMPRPLAGLCALLALSGAGGGAAAAWLRPRSRYRLARTLDRRLALAERLTTAWEIGAGRLSTAPAMVAAQRADTLEAIARTDIRSGLPLRLPRPALLTGLALTVALALMVGLPNPQEAVLARRAAVRAAVEEQLAALQAAEAQVTQAEMLTPQERATLLQTLEETIAALEEGQATPEEAVAALAQAERALAPLQDPGAAAVRSALARAAADMADSELTRDLAEALAQGNYTAAAQQLAAFAGDQGQALTRAEELALARELAQAAATLAESNPALAQQLEQAAQAIEQGNIARARQALAQAAEQMVQAGQRVEQAETVEETLATLQSGREQIAQAGGQQTGGPGGQQAGGRGNQAGSGIAQQSQPGHHEDAGSGDPYDELYIPYRLNQEGGEVELGRNGEGGPATGNLPLPAPQAGQANIPYHEVYAAYAAQARAALESSYIPLGMRQYVRDYFSSLEP